MEIRERILLLEYSFVNLAYSLQAISKSRTPLDLDIKIKDSP